VCFYVIDQNMEIFRGSVNHRPYFRRFSKNPFKDLAKMLTHLRVLAYKGKS